MKSQIVKGDSIPEQWIREDCFISELWNQPEDEKVSIALARVRKGIKTKSHYLDGIDERYLIIAGKGRVEVDDLPPTDVETGDLVVIPAGKHQRIENTGNTDLLFYCICTPRFKDDDYHVFD